jgi:hypothetical protein
MEMNTTDDTSLLAALEQLAPHDHLSLIYEGPEDPFAVASPFIEQLGGRLEIESGDPGTTVRARLPRSFWKKQFT